MDLIVLYRKTWEWMSTQFVHPGSQTFALADDKRLCAIDRHYNGAVALELCLSAMGALGNWGHNGPGQWALELSTADD